jgi:hypothetical protein
MPCCPLCENDTSKCDCGENKRVVKPTCPGCYQTMKLEKTYIRYPMTDDPICEFTYRFICKPCPSTGLVLNKN